MKITMAKKRKSVRLEPSEKRNLVRFIREKGTKLLAAEALGIAPNTLDRILLAGSGSHDTIERIREVLSHE